MNDGAEPLLRTLHKDLCTQMMRDVLNVLPSDAAVTERVRDVLKDPENHLVDIGDMQRWCAGHEQNLDDSIRQLEISVRPRVAMHELLDAIDARWHDMLFSHAWIVCATCHVFDNPHLLQTLKSIMLSDGEGDDPTSDCADKVFSDIVSRFRESSICSEKKPEEQHAGSTGASAIDDVLSRVLSPDSHIVKLANELAEELDLDRHLKSPDDLVNLLDTSNQNNQEFLGNVISKLGTKLQSKFESKEFQQDELIRDTVNMMSALSKLHVPGGGDGGDEFPTIGGACNAHPNIMHMVSTMLGSTSSLLAAATSGDRKKRSKR